jgi:Zn ribbon nucleic-acid-binding protein
MSLRARATHRGSLSTRALCLAGWTCPRCRAVDKTKQRVEWVVRAVCMLVIACGLVVLLEDGPKLLDRHGKPLAAAVVCHD